MPDAPDTRPFRSGDVLKRRIAKYYVRVLTVYSNGQLYVAPYRGAHEAPAAPSTFYTTDPDDWELCLC